MGTMFTLLMLGILGFIVFFVFKQIQFFIQSVDLYKKMIDQQKTMIDLLRSITKAETQEPRKPFSTPAVADEVEIMPRAVTEKMSECPRCQMKYGESINECPQ